MKMQMVKLIPADESVVYHIPKHYALDVLAKEIAKQERHIERIKMDIQAVKNQPLKVKRWEEQIEIHEKRIWECRQAIKWIMENLM